MPRKSSRIAKRRVYTFQTLPPGVTNRAVLFLPIIAHIPPCGEGFPMLVRSCNLSVLWYNETNIRGKMR